MPSHHSSCLSPDGPDQNLPSGLLILRLSLWVWSALLRPRIVSSHHFTTAVTEGDGSVRVLGHHGSKQPTSNSEPTLRNGAGCLRNSHVAFGVLGDGAFSAVDTRMTNECFIAQDFAMPM
jgi:hypothetical protein